MSSACSVLRRIEEVSQAVAEFLGNPAALTPAVAADLINQIELIRGAVRNLPLASGPKNDLLRRLNQAQFILQNGTLGLSAIEQLLAVLQILQLSAFKLKNRKLPCPQGFVVVHPSNRFNTLCVCR
ncbi:MAG TPA: hypothetical protein GXX33_03285 [Firmicutes bacterium]|uniref:Uncharacterized protein n=1 Tax=Capillibacterium thermochitinicola TaxID=2699427 RepID=A0A8J6LII4_9FIRM|nr:hypothetical protein [Capillibacterium thermochitinicola]MBA2133040.1 hypothetical protein [Capillibacterium thermochitinicola]HHW12006.1 hypothetical protein [Bacillota bacterium]